MAPLRETRLVRASVPRSATFLEAARALFGTGISAIAVLDAENGSSASSPTTIS
jgi:hypothetical protein